MAHIRMKYLFIKKDNGENDKNIKEIVYEFLTDNFVVDKTHFREKVSFFLYSIIYCLQRSGWRGRRNGCPPRCCNACCCWQ